MVVAGALLKGCGLKPAAVPFGRSIAGVANWPDMDCS